MPTRTRTSDCRVFVGNIRLQDDMDDTLRRVTPHNMHAGMNPGTG